MGARILAVDARGRRTQHETAETVVSAVRAVTEALDQNRRMVTFTAVGGSPLELPLEAIRGIDGDELGAPAKP